QGYHVIKQISYPQAEDKLFSSLYLKKHFVDIRKKKKKKKKQIFCTPEMNFQLLVFFAITICLAFDDSFNFTSANLTCNSCSFGLSTKCLIRGTVECTMSEPNCYTGKAEFPSIIGALGLITQGCLKTETCNTTENGEILGAMYKTTYTCCNTDKCNKVTDGSGSVHLSLAATLSATLVAFLRDC
ncbi:hypothetical protein GJAV_G00008950, partial [Gymnothorax javanicus]